MIYYLVTAQHSYTIASFLEGWGKALAGRFRVGAYETLLQGSQLPVDDAVYLFTDLDRLGPADPPSPARARFAELCDRLAEVCGRGKVLNHPLRTLPRHALLRALYERGLNRFNAYSLAGMPATARYPLILRRDAEFEANAMPLARNARELQAASAGMPYDLAVEFCDTADARGIYRKYGAFVVGDRIVARHLFFSRNWQIRNAELDEPALLAEERAYVEDNPHAAALLEVCRIAGVGYGRIDYAMLDGKPQVWEINTNPLIAGAPSAEIPARHSTHQRFIERFGAALDALDPAGETTIRKMTGADYVDAMALLALWNMAPVAPSAALPNPERAVIQGEHAFVAVAKGRLVGVASYFMLDATRAETASLAVHPDWRGRGIGERLHAARIAEMRGRGVRHVRTEADRPETIDWYVRKFGYRVTGRAPKKHPFSRTDIADWTVLELDLAP